MNRPSIQHNTPISMGGKHELNNISVICHNCNVKTQPNKVTGELNNKEVIEIWNSILGQSNVSPMTAQVRLGKGRIKDTLAETSSARAASSQQLFDFAAYLEGMRTSPQRHVQIIGRFFHAKGISFDNDAQVRAAIKRHLRPAKDLTAFSNDQIDGAIQKVERQYPDIEWTLETLVKVLTK